MHVPTYAPCMTLHGSLGHCSQDLGRLVQGNISRVPPTLVASNMHYSHPLPSDFEEIPYSHVIRHPHSYLHKKEMAPNKELVHINEVKAYVYWNDDLYQFQIVQDCKTTGNE